MQREFVPARLDAQAFAQEGAELAGTTPLSAFKRLVADVPPAAEAHAAGLQVRWRARGEERPQRTGEPQAWLHLEASAAVPLVCQRCMQPVDVQLQSSHPFRFVADEATAEAEDDESDEDLLVLVRDFDLLELVEDELLMEIPLVARHDVCPGALKLAATDPAFEAASEAKPNPFAVLEKLKGNKPN